MVDVARERLPDQREAVDVHLGLGAQLQRLLHLLRRQVLRVEHGPPVPERKKRKNDGQRDDHLRGSPHDPPRLALGPRVLLLVAGARVVSACVGCGCGSSWADDAVVGASGRGRGRATGAAWAAAVLVPTPAARVRVVFGDGGVSGAGAAGAFTGVGAAWCCPGATRRPALHRPGPTARPGPGFPRPGRPGQHGSPVPAPWSLRKVRWRASPPCDHSPGTGAKLCTVFEIPTEWAPKPESVPCPSAAFM